MPKLLLLILLVFPLLGVSQRPDLYPITDYTKCYTGFRNGKGDTIWKPQFEKVFQIYQGGWMWQKFGGWIVKSGNKFGVITPDGKMSIQPQYDEIIATDFNADRLIAWKDDKCGVITPEGKIIQPLEYDYIELDYPYYKVDKGRKEGILGYDFEVKIPCKYDDVDLEETYIQVWNDSMVYEPRHVRYFWVRDSLDYYGFCDSTGHQFIPMKYHNITPITYMSKCSKEHEFFSVEVNDRYGIVNREGKEIVPSKFEQVGYHNFIEESCDNKVHEFVITSYHDRKKKKCQGFNLRTGKTSEIYDELYAVHRFFVYKKKDVYGVLDENFKPLINDLEYELSVHKRDAMDRNELLKYSDSILFLIHPVTYQRHKFKKYPVRDKHIGAIHLFSGKTIEVKYDNIEIRRDEDATYYWAFKHNEDGDQITMDIYDVEMQLINTQEFNEMDYLEGTYYRCGKYQKEYIFTRDGKVGSILNNGEVAIPFEYQFVNRVRENCEETELILAKDSLKGVFKLSGEQIIPCQYDDITGMQHQYLLRKGEKYVAMNKEGEVLYKDKDFLMFSTLLDYNRYEIRERKGYNYIYKFTWYIVEDDTLYVEKNARLVKMDSTQIRFDAHLTTVHNHLINKHGRVILQGDHHISFMGQYPVVQSREYTKILDPQGNLLLELDGHAGGGVFGRYLKLYNGDRKVGLYDPKSMKWLIPPTYAHLYPLGNLTDEVCFALEKLKNCDQCCSIIDVNGKRVIDQKFDGIFHFKRGQTVTTFKSDGKYGLINTNLQVILPAEYKAIYQLEGIYWVLKDDRWGAFKEGKKLITPQFDNVSFAHGYKQMIAFTNWNTIAALDHELNFILEPTEIDNLLDDGLRDKLRIGGQIKVSGHYLNLHSEKDSTGRGRAVNNMVILKMLRNNSFDEVWPLQQGNMPIIDGSESLTYDSRRNKRRATRKEITPQFFNKKYYSEIVKDLDYQLTGYNPISEWGALNQQVSKSYSYNNYKIVNGQVLSLKLEELFKPTSGYVPFIEETLIETMNSKQSYGTSCVNLPAVLQDLKDHFLLVSDGIRFYNSSNNRFYFISYKELKPYLKDSINF